MGGEGQVGGPLQELMSSMKAGQLGHKMNDSDIHDQLVRFLRHTQTHDYKPTLTQLGFIIVRKCCSDAFAQQKCWLVVTIKLLVLSINRGATSDVLSARPAWM